MSRKILQIFIVGICMFLLLSCGSKKKKTMAGSDAVSINELIESFPTVKQPFTFTDSDFLKKENDSLLIGADVFYQFVPDSLVSRVFQKSSKPAMYLVGSFKQGAEIYLILKGITADQKALFLTAYNKKDSFIAGMPLLIANKGYSQHQKVTIDNKLNISKEITKVKLDGTTVSGHDMYILNNAAKKFMLIMTDSLGTGNTELENPIDSVPALQKFSGDYGDNKMNLVSIRDAQRPSHFRFFIHLEKEDKACIGELKGEGTYTNKDTAEYHQSGDPCIIKFIFSNTSVTLMEVEGCGSRMGALQCSFNGIYSKKKTVKKLTESQPIKSRKATKK
jgi:hypothetical protein